MGRHSNQGGGYDSDMDAEIQRLAREHEAEQQRQAERAEAERIREAQRRQERGQS